MPPRFLSSTGMDPYCVAQPLIDMRSEPRKRMSSCGLRLARRGGADTISEV